MSLSDFLHRRPITGPVERAPRVLDVFCGAGGLSLGFASAGYEIAAGVEMDSHAADIYRQNIAYFQGRAPIVYGGAERGDMTRLQPEAVLSEVGPCDVLVGGPPCKAFSRVGRGKLNSLSEEGFRGDARNRLYSNFIHFLEVFSPKVFVMENVPGMLHMEGRNVAEVAARALGEPSAPGRPGYVVRYAVLDAAWYGVPQRRQRVIFVGVREDLGVEPTMPARLAECAWEDGYIDWPEEQLQTELFGGALRKDHKVPVPRATHDDAVSVREALGDLPELTGHLTDRPAAKDWSERLDYGPVEPVCDFAELMRTWDGPTSTRERGVRAHFIRHTPRDFETFRRMKHGDTYSMAHAIATRRLDEHLDGLVEAGEVDDREDARVELEPEFVPPYPLGQGFEDRWKKMEPDRPSRTVTAHLSHDTYSHIHYDSAQARAVSVREAARLQSFPDRFVFGPDGGLKSAFAQIGNAVPPLLARAIALHLTELLGEKLRSS